MARTHQRETINRRALCGIRREGGKVKAPQLWFVITPKGRLYDPGYWYGHGHKTRKGAIENAFSDHTYGGITIQEVWEDFKRDGYTVEKRRVI
jgi:hypothetical protein